jgi:hypothetical protein
VRYLASITTKVNVLNRYMSRKRQYALVIGCDKL